MSTLKYALLIVGLGIGVGLCAKAADTPTTAPSTSSAPATAAAPMANLLALGNPALPKKIYTEVYVREKGDPVKGDLVRYDEDELTIKTASDERKLQWTDLTGASAFTLRSRLIDKTQPRHWLALGAFAWAMGTRDQARVAFDRAAALDISTKAQAEAIQKTEPGALVKPVAAPSTDKPATDTTTPDNPGPIRKLTGREGTTGDLFPNVKGH